MYEVLLTAGEIRAIISYYDNAMHYLEDVEDNYDSLKEADLSGSVSFSRNIQTPL